MTRPSREHSADEFGQPASTAMKGLDPPMIGAPSSILLDGIVENESGVTPPPPPISVRAAAIGLLVMFVLGVCLAVWLLRHPAPAWVDGAGPLLRNGR